MKAGPVRLGKLGPTPRLFGLIGIGIFQPAALFLAQAVKPLPVYLPRLSVAGPKGFDDLKESLKTQFRVELDRLITQACAQGPPDSRPRVIGPGPGKIESRAVTEIAEIIGPQKEWFIRNNEAVVIEQMPTGFEYSAEPDKKFKVNAHAFGLRSLSGLEAKHRLEKFLIPGRFVQNDDGLPEFEEHSFTSEFCKALVISPGLLEKLPLITRILTTPIPFLANSQLVYPTEGYDQRFGTYLVPGSPKIRPMDLKEAKAVIDELHGGFCIVDDQSRIHSIARLLTPFARGIIGFDTRTPLWIYRANRPRAGKDYLALLALLIYEGLAFEEAPMERDPAETNKRLVAMARAGRGLCISQTSKPMSITPLLSRR